MKKTYELRESRVEAAYAVITKANKRAAKVGAAPVILTVVRSFEKTHYLGESLLERVPYIVRYVEVEIEGETPKFAGWTFLAVLDHSHDTGTVVRAIPDAVIPEQFWTAKPVCEHCQENRRRKDTYIVQHDDGTIKQVGSTCIQDFLGGQDPQGAIAALKSIFEVCGFLGGDGDEENVFGPREEFRVETSYWLRASVAEVRMNGFLGNAKARDEGKESSSSRISSYFFGTEFEERERASQFWARVTDEDGEVASQLVEWTKTLQVRADDSFLNNVKIIASSSSLGHKDFGIATAAVIAYNRELSRRAEVAHEAANSQYVGEIGKRQVFEATLVALKSWESDYGTTFFHKFIADPGNVLVWFGSGPLCHPGADEVKVGEKVTFKATVKKHDERLGVRQTILNRCSGYTPPAPKVRKPRASKASGEAPVLQISQAV
jgi:hypothetical protein